MPPPLILTLVRHGESLDNLTTLWAGHRNSPLSSSGIQQASLLGTSLQSTPITKLYSSDLIRAYETAKSVWDGRLGIDLEKREELREQNFGDWEGKSWEDGDFSAKMVDSSRDWKFPGGESLLDVEERAKIVVKNMIVPHIPREGDGDEESHIVIVSHGITITEIMALLFRLSVVPPMGTQYKMFGLANTAYNRLSLTFPPSTVSEPLLPDLVDIPRLDIKLLALNVKDHLKGLTKTAERKENDEKRRVMREFFGGGAGTGAVEKGKM